ncbi:MAG: GxxExxY protein [Candidatus Cloacimonetes bacterium]|nr:GxxExxY protein [Candidatus Cloacimonadota bacterium]
MLLNGVNENGLMLLLRKNGIKAEQQFPINVYLDGEIIGNYFADIFVENKIILELKTVKEITSIHRAQVINYLKATGVRLAIVLNFGKEELEFERIIK